LPPVATSCVRAWMVRRGSTVRVRQRAPQERRTSALFCSARLAPERTCGGYGAVYGAFRFEVLAVHVAARLARSALTAPSRARTARLGSVAIRSHRNRSRAAHPPTRQSDRPAHTPARRAQPRHFADGAEARQWSRRAKASARAAPSEVRREAVTHPPRRQARRFRSAPSDGDRNSTARRSGARTSRPRAQRAAARGIPQRSPAPMARPLNG
jgi:hypothetical protein